MTLTFRFDPRRLRSPIIPSTLSSFAYLRSVLTGILHFVNLPFQESHA